MEFVLLAASVIIPTVIGWALLNIIFYKNDPFVFLEKMALSYGLGFGIVTLEMFFFYFLRLRLDICGLLAPWIPVTFLAFILRPKRARVAQGAGALSLFERFLLLGISFEVIFSFFRSLIKPLEAFDSIAMYAVRSKIIYLAGMIPPDFFSRITLNYPNPDHPLLVPLAEVWVYTLLGKFDDLLVKIIFPAYLVSLLIAFFFFLKRLIPRREAFVFTFLLATIPQFNKFATIGYTDFILAYYYSIGTFLLYFWMKGRDSRLLILSGAFLAFGVLAKNEGIVLCLVSIIISGLFLFNNLREKGRILRDLSVFILAMALICGPWLALRSTMRLDNEVLRLNEMGLGRFLKIFTRLDRIPVILYEFQKQFFGPKKWNLIWLVFFSLIVLKIKDSFSGETRYLVLSVILILLFYAGVYLLIPTEGSINWYLGSTVSRLFIHFVPVVVFWAALTCSKRGLT